MFYSIILAIELLALFFFSQLVSKLLSRFFITITRSQKVTIYLLSVFFLPGVMVHELAHWFVASILFVRTGEIEFLPQIQGDVVKLGSVAVAKTDPVRKTLIGVAPVLVGIGMMFLIFMYFAKDIPAFNLQTLLIAYFFFEVGNTMFSSKKDLEGTLFFVIAAIFIVVLLYLFKIPVHTYVVSFLSQSQIASFINRLDDILFFPLTIDIVLCSIAALVKRRY